VKKETPPLIRVFQDHKAQWPGLFVLAASAALTAVFKFLSAVFWGTAVDSAVAGEYPAMRTALLLMLLFVFLNAVKMPIHFFILGKTTEKMFMNIRLRAFSVLTRGDTASLEKNMRSGDIALRINSDSEQLCNSISENFPHIVHYIVQLAVGITGCVVLSWQLSIAYLVIVPVSIWLVKIMGDPIQNQRKLLSQASGKAMNLAVGVINGLAAVKSFALEPEMNRLFSRSTEAAYKQAVMTEKTNAAMNMVKQVSSLLQIMALFVAGTYLVYNNLLTLGNMLSFIAVSALITEVLGEIDRMASLYNQALALSRRLYDVYDIPFEPQGEEELGVLGENEDLAVFENVSFSYTGGGPFLTDINIRVGQNQKVGIIGPSGSGKSTIVKLLCGFYRPAGGKIIFEGRPVETLRLDALRGEIALVDQNAGLFDASVYENVRYGRPEAGEEEVLRAIGAAKLQNDMADMPEGVNTRAGESGGRLSGGQRQRAAIARSLLKNARLVILDEAASALDTKTEAEIQAALDVLLKDRAVISIAHRLTAVKNMDYLYCMDGGRVVEEGPPRDLLKLKGYYYNMCREQGLLKDMEGAPDGD
jgi:ABC-type multidrug transport system fused ATPase/permease subunit